MGGDSLILQGFQYGSFDRLNFFQNLIVPKPQYSECLSLEPCTPICIVSNLLGMLPAIQLDN